MLHMFLSINQVMLNHTSDLRWGLYVFIVFKTINFAPHYLKVETINLDI